MRRIAKRRYWRSHVRENLLCQARYRAKRDGLDFDIELEDIVLTEFCPYLGLRLEQARGSGPRWHSPTLDRVDNSKGYVEGNVEIVSYKANALKRDLSLREMAKMGKALLERSKR